MNNRAKAAALVSNHCHLDCPDRHGKECTNQCYYDLVNRVEEILNRRDQGKEKDNV